MIKLSKFIKEYNLEKIFKLESQDPQFIALENSWKFISKKYGNVNFHQNIFLFLILQNALVGYQISGGGELWWQEFSEKIIVDFEILVKLFSENKSNVDRWYNFLTNSRYNKRIYNIKTQRLRKFEEIKKSVNLYENFGEYYYENMLELLNLICNVMNQKPDSKTVVFAIKMFGYGARIIFDKIIPYDENINIPLDSRLKKIYALNFPDQENVKNSFLKEYFFKLAKKNGIPPLHLDSVLWLNYWKEIIISKTKNAS